MFDELLAGLQTFPSLHERTRIVLESLPQEIQYDFLSDPRFSITMEEYVPGRGLRTMITLTPRLHDGIPHLHGTPRPNHNRESDQSCDPAHQHAPKDTPGGNQTGRDQVDSNHRGTPTGDNAGIASRCVVLRERLGTCVEAYGFYVIAHELAHAFLRNGGWNDIADREEAADALAASWGYRRPIAGKA